MNLGSIVEWLSLNIGMGIFINPNIYRLVSQHIYVG